MLGGGGGGVEFLGILLGLWSSRYYVSSSGANRGVRALGKLSFGGMKAIPIGSKVVPCWGYLIGSLRISLKKELLRSPLGSCSLWLRAWGFRLQDADLRIFRSGVKDLC